jgi:hypothetical protein
MQLKKKKKKTKVDQNSQVYCPSPELERLQASATPTPLIPPNGAPPLFTGSPQRASGSNESTYSSEPQHYNFCFISSVVSKEKV